jgi:hypothetical protein
MLVESLPAILNTGSPLTIPRQSDRETDSSFDTRWAAWIERGRQHNLVVQHRTRVVLLAAVVIGILAALFFVLAGGAR